MQQNSTARAIVNKTLLAMGYISIATDAAYATGIVDQFGNLPGGLDKYQQQAVIYLDIFQQALSLVFNKPKFFRKFNFSTVAPTVANPLGTQDYTLRQATIEGFKPNSFFNVTTGAGLGNKIRVVPYDQYNQAYARPDLVPIGAPVWLVPLPESIDGPSDSCKVRLVPTPDQVYTIEGQTKIIVPPIMAGSDRVVFPYQYEQALIMKLKEIMETGTNEGRDASARSYAEQFWAEVFRDSNGADEEVDMIDTGIRLWTTRGRGDSARDYNPVTDTVVPYP